MRSRIVAMLACALIIGSVGVYTVHSYRTFNEPRVYEVLIDFTDFNSVDFPELEHIYDILGFEDDPNSGVQLRVSQITDHDVSYHHEFIYTEQFHWTVEDDQLSAAQARFRTSLGDYLSGLSKEPRSRSQSAIYLQINERLRALSSSKHSILEIHAWSDGYENTEQYSVYTNGIVDPTKLQPDRYASELRKIQEPVKAGTVQLSFHYTPSSRQESQNINMVLDTYRLLYPKSTISLVTQQ